MTTEIFRSPYAAVTQAGSRYFTSVHGEEGPSYDDLTKAVQFASLQSMVAGAERARDAYELADHITSILQFVSANPHLRRSLGYFHLGNIHSRLYFPGDEGSRKSTDLVVHLDGKREDDSMEVTLERYQKLEDDWDDDSLTRLCVVKVPYGDAKAIKQVEHKIREHWQQ